MPDQLLYHFLHYFFLVFHSAIIIFNLFGWIWKKTRVANLILLLLTAFSWFVLGLFYGIGYCVSTDWHWSIMRKIGITGLPSSYTEYLMETLLKVEVSSSFADILTGGSFALAMILSVVLNIRDYRRKKN